MTEVLSFCPIREGSLGREAKKEKKKRPALAEDFEERKRRRMIEKYCSFLLEVI